MTDFERIADLVFRHLSEPLPEAERVELDTWLAASPVNQLWFTHIQEEEELRKLFLNFHGDNAEASKARVAKRIEAEMIINSSTIAKPTHRVHFLKTTWFRYAAAILIIAAIGSYLWNTQRKENTVITTKSAPAKNDIPAGTDRAILTLSNGQQVQLNAGASEIIQDGALSIANKDGQLIYKNGTSIGLNTMSTPRGGQYKLTLADRTRVWLNAASSITYPAVFSGDSREVSITGEAYFEVAVNKEKPFTVKTNQEKIVVLGTSFNVNSYTDEPVSKISLIEGSVKINDKILKPAEAYLGGKVLPTNIERDIAWKNGYFNFNGADLQTVMRQLSRWYDLQIVYEKQIPDIHFVGKMTRNISLNSVLKILEGAGVKFTIENKKLIVRS